VGTALFDVMGATIAVLWLATLAVALRFLIGERRPGPIADPEGRGQSPGLVPPTERGTDPVLATAVRLGLAVTLLGLLEGFAMIAVGGHSVGVADGGPGLPLLGWSTTGGDLRIAHFVGMHALQGLPLLAAGLAAVRGPGDTTRVSLLRITAAAWAGTVVLLTWQALRAQPLLAPDTATLAALGALVVVLGAALAAAAVTTRRHADCVVAGA
jgi:hypothetical protein